MTTKSFTISILILSTFLLNAQEVTTKSKRNKLCKKEHFQIDAFLSSTYEKEKTGIAVLVSKNGKIIYENYAGLSDIQQKKSVKRSTKFNIGSITKQFTAAAILLLQEQGKLEVSDYLGEHLEMFNKEKYPIKIEHLLTHTSGIYSKKLIKASETALSKAELNSFELLFAPGEKYEYSNNGYILLGLLIEKISGIPYKDFINKHIFIPLKMTNSTFTNDNAVIKKKAIGYDSNEKGEVVPVNFYISTFSAGDIISTPRDMNKWAKGLFNHEIINQSNLSAMLKGHQLNNGEKIHYGFGWELNKVQKSYSYEHSGSTPGFKANSIYLPEEKLYIIVMQNSEVGSPTYPSIQITSALIEQPYPLTKESIILSLEERKKFIGTYTIENGGERYIGHDEDTGLYYKRPGGIERKVYAQNDSTLFFKQGYINLTFREASKIGFTQFIYKNRISESTAIKKSAEIPKKNEAINVDSSLLKEYTGTYISEQITITISLEKGLLFGQPKGSDKLELKPIRSNKFFIKEIGAEIEFTHDTEASYINILLEGNVIKGVKE